MGIRVCNPHVVGYANLNTPLYPQRVTVNEYRSQQDKTPLNANFDTKLAFVFLLVLMMESCKYTTHIPHSIPISARTNYKSSKSPFSAFSLHLMKVRIFASTDLKFPFSPAKMHPTRDDYYTCQRIKSSRV